MGTRVLLDLMGGVALLLWGLHMVQSGIVRACGSDLRHLLSRALGDRFRGFAVGVVLTTVLQSSTATGLMTASFAAQELVGLVPALAILLGANVGTTFIVQILSFDIAAAAPVLFILGLASFKSGGRGRIRDLGRVAIGLGLVLLSLHTLLDTLAPAEHAPGVKAVLAAVTGDPLMCILLAAGLTWAAHSSVATVLLIMSLAYSNFLAPAAVIALVLGANLGSAINPLIEGTQRGDATSFRLPVGNLVNRLCGVLLVVPFIDPIARGLLSFAPDLARMAAAFHMIFNVSLALLFIGLLDPLAAILVKVFPAAKVVSERFAPRYLNAAALDSPRLALADASREALRMGELVEVMLRQVADALMKDDRPLVRSVVRMDDDVDKLDEAIKLHITKLTRSGLDDRDGRRAMEIVSFAINLEHIGDIIDKNLCELAVKKIKRNVRFSAEGAEEIMAFHRSVMESFRTALEVFMSGDLGSARKLVAANAELRRAQLVATERHLDRLRAGRPESIETTSLHLDILRDLKRIHSHLCTVAYPVLNAAGEAHAATLESDPITLGLTPARPVAR